MKVFCVRYKVNGKPTYYSLKADNIVEALQKFVNKELCAFNDIYEIRIII